VIERLLEKIRSTDLHRLDREWNIAMPGHHDDGNLDTEFLELVQKLDAAHAWHPDIGDDAARFDVGKAVEESRRRLVGLGRYLRGSAQECERMPRGLVVVDHVHCDTRRHR